MNVYTAEGTQSFFVSSGSYTVNNDSTVSIIAEEACKLSDLDKEAATKALAAAQVNDFKPDDDGPMNDQISDSSKNGEWPVQNHFWADPNPDLELTLTVVFNRPQLKFWIHRSPRWAAQLVTVLIWSFVVSNRTW